MKVLSRTKTRENIYENERFCQNFDENKKISKNIKIFANIKNWTRLENKLMFVKNTIKICLLF